MDQTAAPQPRPQPGVVKTIGILNILFGGVLLMCGLGCLNAMAPAIVGRTPMRLDPEITQAVVDDLQRDRINDLREREKSAGDEAERARIKAEREAVEGKHLKAADEIDFPKINAELGWLGLYLGLDVVTAPFLNLLMLFSGIGLVLRTWWARRLALVITAMKIVRLVALGTLLIAVVIPHVGATLDILLTTEIGRQMITHAIEQQQARQGGAMGGPLPSPQEVARLFRGVGIIYAALFVCLGSIYPLVALILLSRPGARAVFDSTDPEEGESWDSPSGPA